MTPEESVIIEETLNIGFIVIIVVVLLLVLLFSIGNMTHKNQKKDSKLQIHKAFRDNNDLINKK